MKKNAKKVDEFKASEAAATKVGRWGKSLSDSHHYCVSERSN
jgi:hypothetical protein